MTDNVQQIKERLNIVDVLSGYIRLTKAGVNYKALCPFHNEKTPSFMVSPSRQSWHCFGSCGEGGDIFTFIEKIEGIEFPEALKILADKAGIILKYDDPKLRSQKDRAYEICEKAAQFFTQELNNTNTRIYTNDTNNAGGNPIVNYLHKRGLNDKTIEEWRLGYAPDSWSSLLSFLGKYGYSENEIEKAGLAIKGEKWHDRFRNRLMFPIFDTNGRVAAFSGRTMQDIIPSKTEKTDTGKYVNSPETILYNKSRILYGLDRAKNNIRKDDKAILVEGQMDVALSWQDGVKNVIATSGTALTEDQLVILKRLTGNLVLAFDMDEAGFRATKRGVDLAQSFGFNISVLRLESGKDAADFIKDNPEKFGRVIEKAESIMSYYFKEIFKKISADKLEGKKIIALNLLPEIKRLPSAIERSNWIRELGLHLGVSETDLKEEMDQLTPTDADGARADAEKYQHESALGSQRKSALTRKEILSERLLALLLKKPELVCEAVKAAVFLPQNDFEILSAFSANSADKSADAASFSDIRSVLSNDLRPRLDFLYLAGDYEIEKLGPGFNLDDEIKYLIRDIEKEHYKEALNKIEVAIKKNENLSIIANDSLASESGKNLETLTKEFQNISQKLLNLDKK